MATTSQEKRPRIRPDVADHIDMHRGQVPFERFVNTALMQATGDEYTLEPGDARGTFRVCGEVERSRELRPQEATDHAEILNHTGAAIRALMSIQEFEGLSEIQFDLFNLAEDAMRIIDKIVDAEKAYINMLDHSDEDE